ncbi:DUF7576 family protein [Halogeometricum borinquense]|uniref:DUF7576 family protein n=2 Tax=Halogeometricum borinquense TaxID=60847 RepID=UPI003BB94828
MCYGCTGVFPGAQVRPGKVTTTQPLSLDRPMAMREQLTSHFPGRQIDRCAACDSIIDVSEWHPTKASQTRDGETVIHSFCSDRCRAKWMRR